MGKNLWASEVKTRSGETNQEVGAVIDVRGDENLDKGVPNLGAYMGQVPEVIAM